MSPRSSTTGPEPSWPPPRRTAVTDESPRPGSTSRSSSASESSTRRWVFGRWRSSSGTWCSARRSATRSGSMADTRSRKVSMAHCDPPNACMAPGRHHPPGRRWRRRTPPCQNRLLTRESVGGRVDVAERGLQAALPREMYVDDGAWRAEREAVLYGEWFCVGRVAALGLDAGRRVAVVDVAGESVLVTCDDAGVLHAAYNVCRHRGSQIHPVTEPPSPQPVAFAASALRCPYHSWTYGLDGRVLRTPHTDLDDPACFALEPVGVDTW